MGTEIKFVHFWAATGVTMVDLMWGMREHRGIYFLGFADGREYVGQAANVLSRYSEHVRSTRWGSEIISLNFAPIPGLDLDTMERLTVRWRRSLGVTLHNKNLLNQSATTIYWDEVFRDHHQITFEPCDPPPWTVRTVYPAESLKRYLKVMQDPQYDDVLDAAAALVRHAIPDPVRTEQTSWVLSAAPKIDFGYRRLLVLTLQDVELLTIFESPHDGLWACLRLDLEPNLTIDYDPNVVDLGMLGIFREIILRPKGLAQALESDEELRHAARSAALYMIDEEYPSYIGPLHCNHLADAVLARVARAVGISSTDDLPDEIAIPEGTT